MPESPPRVLVVEDDDATRVMLTEFLSEEGFAVSSALDGAHALRAAAAGMPDLIVLDIGLPILDGTGLARQWRERAGAVASGWPTRSVRSPTTSPVRTSWATATRQWKMPSTGERSHSKLFTARGGATRSGSPASEPTARRMFVTPRT